MQLILHEAITEEIHMVQKIHPPLKGPAVATGCFQMKLVVLRVSTCCIVQDPLAKRRLLSRCACSVAATVFHRLLADLDVLSAEGLG